ncbi:MAG: hypothetical protein ABUL41_01575 [Chitinophagaceae bacterium]
MLAQINRKDCLKQYPDFPQTNGDDFFFPKVFSSYTFTLQSKSLRGHVKNLSFELVHFILDLGYDELIFLGDSATAWLYQDNDYKPAKEALRYLKNQKIGKRFNGALIINDSDLQEFCKNLFWLTRCNASFPDIYFTDKKQNILGNICKYGSLHFYTLNRKTDNAVKKNHTSNFFYSNWQHKLSKLIFKDQCYTR